MKNIPLKEKVYKTLRYDILTGKIPGGTRITESNTAARLNVSRTPIREALQRLTQEKLVISLPKAGYLIEDMSNDDIQDLFSARFDIETMVTCKAIDHITNDELEIMGKNLEKAKACIDANDLKTMTDLDIEFHSIIYKASRSKTFFRICKNLSDLTMKYRHGLNLRADIWNVAIDNHMAIYKALVARDKNLAARAVNFHSEQVKSQLLDIMKKVRSDSFFLEEL